MGVGPRARIRHLFDGRDMTPESCRIRPPGGRCRGRFHAVRGFLDDCLPTACGSASQLHHSHGTRTGPVLSRFWSIAFVVAVLGWAGYVEWRYHRNLNQVFPAEALHIGLDRDGVLPDLARGLTSGVRPSIR